MVNGKDNNTKDGHKWTPTLVAIVAAAVGSLGTVSIYLGTPFGQEITRPDPFTGTEAAALIRRFDRLESRIGGHLTQHPDKSNQYDRRIATLEAQYTVILKNQDRILDRLDGR